MATKVLISDEAQNLLNEIIDHLEKESFTVNIAKDFKARVLNIINLLELFPRSGRKLEGELSDYRMVFIKKYHYVFLYKYANNIVYIERIYHMAQNYQNLPD